MTIKINTTILQSNREYREHQKYFWNAIALQEKSQSGTRKLNHKQQPHGDYSGIKRSS